MSGDHTDAPRCTATAKGSGERCKRRPVPGGTVCVKHGGGNPAVRAAGLRRLEEMAAAEQVRSALAEAFGEQVPEIAPAEAMLQAVSWKYSEVVFLRGKVAELSEKQMVWGKTRSKTGGEDYGTTRESKPNVWWAMLRTAEEQLVKFAAAARAAGCDERRVQLAEQQGVLLAGVIRRVLDRLELSDPQRELVSVVVPQELRALEAGGGAG